MTPDEINEFFSFLYQDRLGEVTFWLRFLSGIVTAALAAAIAVILVKFRELISGARAAPVAGAPDVAAPTSPWQEVRARMESPNPADWNLAVIRADAIADEVLKGMGLAGETTGERLKQLDRARLASLDGLWEAHKIRNRIVHDTDLVLAYAEAKRAIMLYAQTLRELGYLQE